MALFEKSEYLTRFERTKDRMEKGGLEVLIIVDPANINYLTGYDAQSYYVEQAVIIDLDADEPLWIGRKMDIACVRFTSWLSPQNMTGYPEELVQSRLKHPFRYIAGLMKEKGMGNKRIGAEMDAPHFTPRSYEELKAGLPDAKIEDARLLVSWVRNVKSPAEIALMKKAGRVVNKVMQAAVDAIGVGVRESDAAAAVLHAQAAGTNEFGGDYTSHMPFFGAGKRASAPHLTWTDERFQNETNVNVELAACVKRYHCPPALTNAEAVSVSRDRVKVAIAYASGGPAHKNCALARGATVRGAGVELEGGRGAGTRPTLRRYRSGSVSAGQAGRVARRD